MNTGNDTSIIISHEKETLQAFKDKDKNSFTQHFGEDYIGVANDGIKSASDEVTGMKALELSSLFMTDESVFFPADSTAIITYKMNVKGQLSGKDISGPIYCSTAYIRRGDKWNAVLHTESKG